MYHSALKPDLPVEGELDRCESSGSLVFCHDVSIGMSREFVGVDAIYSEPSWRDGYGIFMARAGRVDTGFVSYMVGIHSVIEALKVPTYLVIGKHMLKVLNPTSTLPVSIHGYPCFLGMWNVGSEEVLDITGSATNNVALEYIATRYSRVLDFSCGYGNTAGAMVYRGKKFVCSDINKKCVYHVAKEYMGYAL